MPLQCPPDSPPLFLKRSRSKAAERPSLATRCFRPVDSGGSITL